MCTVTFIPNKLGYTLTSNRDEHIKRLPSLLPLTYTTQSGKLIYPMDQLAGGTWIAADDQGRAACILNGAFENHARFLPYRLSRGQIVLNVFDYKSNSEFVEHVNLENIEPFTLILIAENSLIEFRWDSIKKHINYLDSSKNHIWSSSTLYNKAIRDLRKNLFQDFIQEGNHSPGNIFEFHKTGNIGDVENNLQMKRPNGVQTVSITQIKNCAASCSMIQENFAINKQGEAIIQLTNKSLV